MPRTDWGQSWFEYHLLEDPCRYQKWCRLHWFPVWNPDEGRMEPKAYPLTFKIPSSRNGWQSVDVFCGPGAFTPRKN